MTTSMNEKGIQAAQRFLERRGYTVLEEGFCPEEGGASVDIVAKDEDGAVVFVDVLTRADNIDAGFDEDTRERSELEVLAAKWLGQHADELESDVSIRFDSIALLVVSPDRAILRHHQNRWG